MTISLCSGCLHYYLDNCDKPYEDKAETMNCDKFKFTRTKHFRRYEDLETMLKTTTTIPDTKQF